MPVGADPRGGRPAPLLASGRRSRLAALAAELESRHGPARAAGQPPALVERVARKLAKSRGDLAALEPKEKKSALELFWRPGLWIAQPADVVKWLRWAEAEWRPRVAETRICAAMLRHFDPQNPTTAFVGGWLAPRQERIWGRFGEFARRWRLADGAEARENIAMALAAGEMSFLRELERNFQAKVLLQGSGFLVAVIESYAHYSSARSDDEAMDSQTWAAADGLLDLLGPSGLAGAHGPEALRRMAKIAMLSGLVAWAARLGSAPAVDKALRLCFRLAGDPRESMAGWREAPPKVIAQVEKWLVERTIALAFQIVEDLKTDDAAALRKRREFWLGQLPFITRARLLGAPKAARAAALVGAPCCALTTYLSDHCGFLAELQGETGQRLHVVELNNLAQTMFWPDESPNKPAFDQSGYDGSALRANCKLLLSHLPPDAWPSIFADLIAQETGARSPE